MNGRLFMFLLYKEMHDAGLMDDTTWKKFLCNCLVVEFKVIGLDIPEELKKTLTTYGADENSEKDCNNCMHGGLGPDDEHGCDSWRRGMTAENCKRWKGKEE